MLSRYSSTPRKKKMKEKKSKKEWKWANNPVKKDLYSGKYGQKIKPVKKDTGPSIEEGLDEFYEEGDTYGRS